MREDVIESIKAGLADGFHPSYALQVWPQGDSYLILSGHHRHEAAKRAGINEVPCFVREDLDKDQAYMVLATANSQGELSPLEIGFHLLGYIPLGKKGRGNDAGGIREYARRTGRDDGNLVKYRNAAKVAKNAVSIQHFCISALLDKALHLSVIHTLKNELLWEPAVAAMLDGAWSVKETSARIDEVAQCTTHGRQIALLQGRTTLNQLKRVDEALARIGKAFEFEEVREAWGHWINETDPIDMKQVQEKRLELEERESRIREAKAVNAQMAEPNLVLADPPWRYDFAETDSRQIENQYPSATAEEICGMGPRTQPDAVLLLWATVAKLTEALQVMEAWGFEYKTSAVWDKEKIGMGYWFRGQHELLLVGTKGKFSPPDESVRRSSVFREERGKHSAKPECVYQWIETAFPEAKKLEMFCRNPRAGWVVHGNEA